MASLQDDNKPQDDYGVVKILTKDIYVLGIESSCDDTGAAVVATPRQILSNIVISQNSEHMPFCGVVPEIAARSHMQNLEHAIHMALSEAKLGLTDIDAIAATSGPGLIGGVIVGSMLGRALASVLKKPFIAVNHLEGHALSACLSHGIPFPYLLLLVSGGHCQFVAIQSLGRYKILGQTIDDAVGEAFDKVAKMLGLPFPGGPEIERLAKLGDPYKYILPKPIINQDNCNMSFSGLKTAIRTLISRLNIDDKQTTHDIAASFQYTIGCILSIKLAKAIIMYEQLSTTPISDVYSNDLENWSVKQGVSGRSVDKLREYANPLQFYDANPSNHLSIPTIVVAGGVAANQYIINILQEKASALGYTLIAPPIKLCTDNAAMIAFAGIERLRAGLTNSNSFCPRARWGLEEL